MKKVLIIILAIVIIAGLAVGGAFFYITSTPEYALVQTIKDVKAEGMDGLKEHLTPGAIRKIEAVEDLASAEGVTGVLSGMVQRSAVDFLKSKMNEVEWTVEDVMKGSDTANVTMGFDYNDSIVGTIAITMLKDGREWKIDGLEFPKIDKFSLW